MKIRTLILCGSIALLQLSGADDTSSDQIPVPDVQELEAQLPPRILDGFGGQVSSRILVLRAGAVCPELELAQRAIAELGRAALDRVSLEVLCAIARGAESERRLAALEALLSIGERALTAGDPRTASEVGGFIFLSSSPQNLRDRAWPLFAAFDSPELQRNLHLAPTTRQDGESDSR